MARSSALGFVGIGGALFLLVVLVYHVQSVEGSGVRARDTVAAAPTLREWRRAGPQVDASLGRVPDQPSASGGGRASVAVEGSSCSALLGKFEVWLGERVRSSGAVERELRALRSDDERAFKDAFASGNLDFPRRADVFAKIIEDSADAQTVGIAIALTTDRLSQGRTAWMDIGGYVRVIARSGSASGRRYLLELLQGAPVAAARVVARCAGPFDVVDQEDAFWRVMSRPAVDCATVLPELIASTGIAMRNSDERFLRAILEHDSDLVRKRCVEELARCCTEDEFRRLLVFCEAAPDSEGLLLTAGYGLLRAPSASSTSRDRLKGALTRAASSLREDDAVAIAVLLRDLEAAAR